MNSKSIFLHITLVLCLLGFNARSYSQVTIGSATQPLDGALLDLKEEVVANGEKNSSKGLGLPRVRLSSHTDLFPMFSKNPSVNDKTTLTPTADYDTPVKKKAMDDAHVGLLVYNVTNEMLDFCPGLHMWDGKQWVEVFDMTSQEATTSTTLTDRDGYTYKIGEFGSAGTWMLENLRTNTTRCGRKLTVKTKAEVNADPLWTDPSMSYPEDKEEYADKYGAFYSWITATNGKGGFTGSWGYPDDQTPSGGATLSLVGVDHKTSQGICPKGWHVPSEYEWYQLFEYMHDNYTEYTVVDKLNPQPPFPAWSDDWKTGFLPGTTPARYRGYMGAMVKTLTTVDGTPITDTKGASKPASEGGFDAYLVGTSLPNSIWGNNVSYWTSSHSTDNLGGSVIVIDQSLPGISKESYARRRHMPIRCMKDRN